MTRVLVAEDEEVTRTMVCYLLRYRGYHPIEAINGDAAWEIIQRQDRPLVGLLDWSMPGLEGPEICHRARSLPAPAPYLIMLTAHREPADLAAALDAGASDFVSKPFSEVELRARVSAGMRAAQAESQLALHIAELEAAQSLNRRLQELLPICAWCKAVRIDDNYWRRVEDYLTDETGRTLTHGLPGCMGKLRAEASHWRT